MFKARNGQGQYIELEECYHCHQVIYAYTLAAHMNEAHRDEPFLEPVATDTKPMPRWMARQAYPELEGVSNTMNTGLAREYTDLSPKA